MKKALIIIFSFSFLFLNLRLSAKESDLAGEMAADDNKDSQASALADIEERKISLTLRNIDIIEALKFFSLKTGLSIVPTQKVAGRVTLTVENIPTKDVIDIMLRSNNLAYQKKGNIYHVMTEAEYKALFGKSFSDKRKVEMFRLKYAIPEPTFNLLDAIKSDIGRLLVDAESGTVMMMDLPEKIEEAKKALETLEQKVSIRVFDLQYAKAKDIETQLKPQLDAKKAGSIKAYDRTNQVMVQALPERMDDIAKIISRLDKKTQAVMIETKIIKIRLSNQLDQGVEWEGLFDIARKYGTAYLGSYPFSLIQSSAAADTATGWQSRMSFLDAASLDGSKAGAYPFSGTTTDFYSGKKVVPGQEMHIGMIDKKRDFDVMIKYLQTLGKTKIISSPTLTVINNEEANILVGEKRAYITTTVTTGATTTTTAEQVTYVDVGVKLSLTPLINEEGYVTLKVKPEISSVVGNVNTSSGNVVPIIDTSMAETTIIAKDGTTVLIGGLGREEKTESSEQVPILGKIPLLGFFFRSKTQSTARTELLIMLTPVICEGDKFITVKDKENERFGVKPAKKFDVFKPEMPEEFVPEVSSMEMDDFIHKGLKPYSKGFGEEAAPEPITKPSGGYKEKILVPKGFKGYN
ncbi:MAG: hypothetical protein JW788_00390 [Candidatus Omnitrophica bacterium]|nr:hypothetical protein [Candidatus Omnitrophota bacterium]